MRKKDYDSMMKTPLDSGTYQVLRKGPTTTQVNRIGHKLKELVQQGETSESLYCTLRTSESQPQKVYGLPKVKKSNLLRPIASFVRAVQVHHHAPGPLGGTH